MNLYESLGDLDSFADLLGTIESEENDEGAELDENVQNLARRLRSVKPKVPTGSGLFQARPPQRYVTQLELQVALGRVGAQIKTHAEATKAVSTRVNTLNLRVDAEVAARKKEDTAIRKDISNGRMMSILPLLMTSAPKLKSIDIQENGTTVTKTVTKSEFEKQDMMPMALMLMMGSMSDNDSKTNDNSMMMMLPLVLILSQQNKS
ncbi:hypothetical protein [Cupriavidus oxalaticus]|uniref:Uncharacterized protein n=1 Tax=Cupriavidus oxalaticus TaxID=96344 RepID=A0A4P7LSI2_9BURK|nr:hypothetical protein [Cupriavidus oxalaticus]QBY55461.1 hypothetical protein E0W60_30965 [Cupriavidus oxalaticus]